LEGAFLAYQNRDYARMIGQILQALDLVVETVHRTADGDMWSFMFDSAAVYLRLDKAGGTFAIESPLVRVPQTQRIPLMRTLLELSASAVSSARFCVRDDLVVLRFSAPLDNLPPPKLMAAIREVSVLADRYDDLLALTFDTVRIGPRARAGRLAPQFVGTPKRIALLAQQIGQAQRPRSSTRQEPPRDLPQVPVLPFVELEARPAPLRLDLPSPHAREVRVSHAAQFSAPRDPTVRPVAPSIPDARQAAFAQAQEREGSLKPFLNELRHIHQTLSFLTEEEPLLLACRGVAHYLRARFESVAPDAVHYLLGSAALIALEEVPQRTGGLMGLKRGFRTEFQTLRAMVPAVGSILQRPDDPRPSPRVGFQPLRTGADVRVHVRKILQRLDQCDSSDSVQYLVLVGAAGELLIRATLPTADSTRLRDALREADMGQSTVATRLAVRLVLEELAK